MSITASIVNILIAQYGLPGIVIVGLSFMYWKTVKRNRELEDRQLRLETDRHKSLVGLVKDYAEQTKNLTEMITKLSSVLQRQKESLERIERSREIEVIQRAAKAATKEPEA